MQAECLIDRFGHTIDIYYTNTIRNSSGYNVYVYGRPLISSIEGNWDNSSISFNYYLSPYFAVTLQNYKSRFKILCDQAGNLDSTGNHRFYPTQIVNPNGNEINIHYESYSRRALNVYNPNSGSNNMDLFFDDNLRRIDKFTNYFVGEVRYQYQSSNALSVDMNPTVTNYKISSDNINSDYFGQGRDCFFVNMVNSKRSYSGNILTSRDTIIYDYIRNVPSYKIDPVNDSDSYKTTRITSIDNSNPELNNTYPSRTAELIFKNFKIKSYTNSRQEYPDWQGNIKLIKENYYTADAVNPERMVEHNFLANETQGFVAFHSFLDTAVTETLKGVSRKNRFRYSHFNSPFSGEDTSKNPLRQIIEYNPFNTKTVKYFNFLYDISIHYKYAKFNADTSNQEYDTTYFYLSGIPVRTDVFNNSGTLQYRDTSNYISENGLNGYLGQTIFKRILDPGSLGNYKETLFEYFVNDTIGKGLYPTENTKPSNEGNLKSITDARGNKTKFFYHPVYQDEFSDEIPRPRIKYNVVKSNGTTEQIESNWEDQRFPTITEYFPSEDRYLLYYNKYDPSGNMTNIMGNEKYLNLFTFDNLERIQRATLPTDFGYPSP